MAKDAGNDNVVDIKDKLNEKKKSSLLEEIEEMRTKVRLFDELKERKRLEKAANEFKEQLVNATDEEIQAFVHSMEVSGFAQWLNERAEENGGN